MKKRTKLCKDCKKVLPLEAYDTTTNPRSHDKHRDV